MHDHAVAAFIRELSMGRQTSQKRDADAIDILLSVSLTATLTTFSMIYLTILYYK
jgi:hypothetical protein